MITAVAFHLVLGHESKAGVPKTSFVFGAGKPALSVEKSNAEQHSTKASQLAPREESIRPGFLDGRYIRERINAANWRNCCWFT